MFKIEQTQKKRPWLSFLLSSSAKKLVPLALIGGSLLMLPAVHAGRHLENLPRGFDNYYNNILAIQSQGRDDEDVCLRGRLTSYLQDDCYEFTDEMGNSIEVELDDDVNWGLVSKDQLIEIFGDIDRNMFRVKIDAKACSCCCLCDRCPERDSRPGRDRCSGRCCKLSSSIIRCACTSSYTSCGFRLSACATPNCCR